MIELEDKTKPYVIDFFKVAKTFIPTMMKMIQDIKQNHLETLRKALRKNNPGRVYLSI